MLLKEKETVGGRYTVLFPKKKSSCSETYRVKDEMGRNYFMKLTDPRRLRPYMLNDAGNPREADMLAGLSHPGVPNLVKNDRVVIGNTVYSYIVTDFVSSETIEEQLMANKVFSVGETRDMAMGLLEVLKFLHGLDRPILHNNISTENILIDLKSNDMRHVKLVDFAMARYADDVAGRIIESPEWFNVAPERLNGVCNVQGDLYSVGAVMYKMLFGLLPWYRDISMMSRIMMKDFVVGLKRQPLLVPKTIDNLQDDPIIAVIRRALSPDVENRYQSADEFIEALQKSDSLRYASESTAGNPKGNGFRDVAGMEDLKQMLENKVLRILRDKEKAQRYKLKIPNGMLLYGPPGSGKTFIAEKFAEESGCNFKFVKASDLGSIYLHGAQEKIGEMFNEARDNAPMVLCIDEFDAMVPQRGKRGSEYQSGEVNEFLSQMNNCGDNGVFVIGTTNRPDMIDSAVLRRGRIDHIVYIPIPDEKSREALFRLYLKDRPCESDIDCARLAMMTDRFIASDIGNVVNEAALSAAFSDAVITEKMLEHEISVTKPSVSEHEIKSYEDLRKKMEGVEEERRRIGF